MTLNLAAFLGMRLRAQGKTVVVVDANYQQADSGKYLDTYTPNINTIVNNPALLTKERILEALVHKPEYNLSVLLGPATPDEGNPLAISARLYNEILDLLLAHYDYVFIDTPVAEKFHEMFSDFALSRADYLIVPVAPNYTTLHNADNWLRAAVVAPRVDGGAAMDPNRVGIVLNRAEDGIGCSESDVRQTMASWHFLGAIPETKEWKAANNQNELVAPKNYAELSQAFAEVLHASTGEPVLLENLGLVQDKSGGLGGKFKGMFRRKS
jgi:MinD-like ATPase involved in chromosome partitioning or flagellar assembly